MDSYIKKVVEAGRGRILYSGPISDPCKDYNFKPLPADRCEPTYHLFYIINADGQLMPMVGRHSVLRKEDEVMLMDDDGKDPQSSVAL